MDSSSEMIAMGNYYGTNRSAGVTFSGNSYDNQGSSCVTQATNSSSSPLLDSVPGLKCDAGSAVEWSVEEQYKLEEGLVKYADDPSIMRYIEIASKLRDKTVRDVALRCRWMTGKRRKQDNNNFGKKMTNKKDKFTGSFLKANTYSVSPLKLAGFSVTRNHQNGTGFMSREASIGAKNLLEQNNQAFGILTANLSSKCCNAMLLQENIDLFCRTRNNITTILNSMSNMPGIMSRMPALPLLINDELADIILPGTSQEIFLHSFCACVGSASSLNYRFRNFCERAVYNHLMSNIFVSGLDSQMRSNRLFLCTSSPYILSCFSLIGK